MIVCYFDIICVAFLPCKADAPLIIDPDAVLTFAVALQLLQSIGRRHSQVVEITGIIYHAKFP